MPAPTSEFTTSATWLRAMPESRDVSTIVLDICTSCGVPAIPALIEMSRMIAPKSALTLVGIAITAVPAVAWPSVLFRPSRPSSSCFCPWAFSSALRAVRPSAA
ncbi:hypothetical protein D3C84_1129940 [compost metagenome]